VSPVLRATKQRNAVSSLLQERAEFHSAQDIYEQLRRRGDGIGLTTVYRTLAALADAGTVDVVRSGAGEARYRRCSAGHHHHLVCRDCGATVEVEGPAVERWAQSVASEHGFTDVAHTVEVIGTCAECCAAR